MSVETLLESVIADINKGYKKEAMRICERCIDGDVVELIVQRVMAVNMARKEVIAEIREQMENE